MNTLNNEILSAIDKIETVTMEAEMNVLTAMCDAYEKSAVILENYEGDDVSCFDIFQEGFKDDVKAAVKGKNGEHIVKRILMVIPRLLMAIVKAINRFFNKKKDQQVINNLQNVKRAEIERVEVGNSKKSQSSSSAMKDMGEKRDESMSNINDRHKINSELFSQAVMNIHHGKNDPDEDRKERTADILSELYLSMYKDKSIKTMINFEDVANVIEMLDKMLSTFNTGSRVYRNAEKNIDEYKKHPIWNVYNNKDDIKRLLSYPEPKEFTIDEACSFITRKTILLENFLDQVKKQYANAKESIRYTEMSIDDNKKRGRSSDPEINQLHDAQLASDMESLSSQRKLIDTLKPFTILIPNLLEIIETEITTWNEAAKIVISQTKDDIIEKDRKQKQDSDKLVEAEKRMKERHESGEYFS